MSSEKEKNGLLPGWPPFIEFKREMQGLLVETIEEHNRPIKADLKTMKETLSSHIESTKEQFKKTDERFYSLEQGQKNLEQGQKNLDNRLGKVEIALTNHITATNKKISDIGEKIGKLLSLFKLS